MSIDLTYHSEARELAGAVRKVCARLTDEAALGEAIPETVWGELARMGVLGLTAVDGGDAQVLAASMIELGRAGMRGPLIGVMAAARALAPEQAEPVSAGRSIPSVGVPPLLPWAPVADVFIEIDDGSGYLAHVAGEIEPVDTLGGEPWGRCTLERISDLPRWPEAATLAEVGAAGYLLGAGQQLLDRAVTYAGQRTQFGRAIGDFQATAHPLASCHLRLAAADTLVRLAAHAVDTGDPEARSRAATARQSAGSAAMDTAYRAHQTLGAMGFTVEGPVGRLSQLIRQTIATAATLTDTTAAVLAPYGM